MKKLLSLLLALALVFSLAGCGTPDTPATPDTPDADVTTTTTTQQAGGESDLPVPPELNPTDEATDDSTTSSTAGTDSPKDTATSGSGHASVIPSTYKPTYTKTVTRPSGGSTTSRRDPVTTQTVEKPTYTPHTGTTTKPSVSADKQLVDQLFALSTGASRDNVTLTGMVCNVKEVSESYGNATFTIRVQSSDSLREILCYRVKPAAGTALSAQVGDTVTLSGTVQNYKGTIEFYPAEFTNLSGGGTTTGTTTSKGASGGVIDPDGVYTRKEDVALYLHTYGRLPGNFVTKSEYRSLGEPRDKCCGGDRFYNKEGLLPNKSGRLYYECDIDTLGKSSRGAKRIVYSNDGLIYYTSDHYGSFTLLYGTP